MKPGRPGGHGGYEMTMTFNALGLATLGCLASMFLPATAEAGNVGYYSACVSENPASAITLAGHTPISVATLDSTSLAPLDGLVMSYCGVQYAGSAAVDTAVAGGLRVLLDAAYPPLPSDLPGDPALSLDTTGTCGGVSISPGSPVANGPGGILTDTNLDTVFLCSPMGSAVVSTLPSGSVSFVELANNPSRTVAFAYPTGSGLVALSFSQWMFTLPGGGYEGDAIAPGANAYYANTIAWMMEQELTPSTTCASEGYTGTKLTWCRNVCENGLTGATLDMWIHRWINRYRDLPYCAKEEAPAMR